MSKASLGMLLTFVSFAISSPAHGAFSMARGTFATRGVAVSGGSYTLGATVAEAGVVGRVSGGSYTVVQGFWPNFIATPSTGVADLGNESAGWVNELRASYPNPFVASTSIAYTVGRPSPVRLSIYDVAGRRVLSLVDAPHAVGRYQVPWPGLDESGNPVAIGVYMIRLEVGNWSATRKMLKIR